MRFLDLSFQTGPSLTASFFASALTMSSLMCCSEYVVGEVVAGVRRASGCGVRASCTGSSGTT